MSPLTPLFVTCCTLLASAGTGAQTVYRCGPEGRVYSQSPCPQGRAVDVSDPRSAEQRAVAEARVREDQALGDAMERERLDREAGKPSAPINIGSRAAAPEAVTKAAKPKPTKKKGNKARRPSADKDDDFKAVSPPKKKPRKGA